MARKRIEIAGGTHHITAKSPSGRMLYRDVEDRLRYLRLLFAEARKRGWIVITYCLMGNHLHLLVTTPEPDLGEGIKAVHETYARTYNERYGEWGHVFGRRFHSEPVLTDRHLIGCLRYIARNPVKAGLCADAADWPWSAHGAIAGVRQDPYFDPAPALATLGTDPTVARTRYLELVGFSETGLLEHLQARFGDVWILRALEDFNVSKAEVAEFLGVSISMVYKRVATARSNQGTVP